MENAYASKVVAENRPYYTEMCYSTVKGVPTVHVVHVHAFSISVY